jgi:hypothetical protein
MFDSNQNHRIIYYLLMQCTTALHLYILFRVGHTDHSERTEDD